MMIRRVKELHAVTKSAGMNRVRDDHLATRRASRLTEHDGRKRKASWSAGTRHDLRVGRGQSTEIATIGTLTRPVPPAPMLGLLASMTWAEQLAAVKARRRSKFSMSDHERQRLTATLNSMVLAHGIPPTFSIRSSGLTDRPSHELVFEFPDGEEMFVGNGLPETASEMTELLSAFSAWLSQVEEPDRAQADNAAACNAPSRRAQRRRDRRSGHPARRSR
jgi:hypothetical protein